MNETQARLRAIMMSPEMQRCTTAVQRIAAYDVPEASRASFLRLHDFVTNPPPKYITKWRSEPRLEKWYRQHLDRVHDCRRALAAAHYHLEQLSRLETAIVEELSAVNFQQVLQPNFGLGFGCTDKLNFEYQAYVFSLRRSLEYLANGLVAYFMQGCQSFKKLPKAVKGRHPSIVADALCSTFEVVKPSLSFILSDETRKTARDRLAHDEHVDVGCLNMSTDGLVFVGGGETLNMPPSGTNTSISEFFSRRIRIIQEAVDSLLDAFINAARQFDQERGEVP